MYEQELIEKFSEHMRHYAETICRCGLLPHVIDVTVGRMKCTVYVHDVKAVSPYSFADIASYNEIMGKDWGLIKLEEKNV